MDVVRAERIEAGVERIAAALFAGATAYAFYGCMSGVYGEPQLGVFSAGTAGVAFLLCARGLRSIPVEERFDLPAFDVPAFDVSAFEPTDELVLEHFDESRTLGHSRRTSCCSRTPIVSSGSRPTTSASCC